MAHNKSGITGIKELQRKLAALRDAPAKMLQRPAAKKAMMPVFREAQRTVPVDSGIAKENVLIKSKTARNGTRAWVDVGVAKEVHYAVTYVERGTSTAPAHPWLVPAFRKKIPKIVHIYREELKKAIEKAYKAQK